MRLLPPSHPTLDTPTIPKTPNKATGTSRGRDDNGLKSLVKIEGKDIEILRRAARSITRRVPTGRPPPPRSTGQRVNLSSQTGLGARSLNDDNVIQITFF
jgi:hypothetical protein